MFPRQDRALAWQSASLTDFGSEVGNEGFLLAAGLHGNGLYLRASDFHWFAILVEFDLEIGQMEYLGVGTVPADSGLDMFNILLLENRIGFWAAVTAISIDRLQLSTLFQVRQRLGQQLAVIGVVGGSLHFGDQLQRVLWVAGFAQVGHVALVAPAAFLAVGGFQIIR